MHNKNEETLFQEHRNLISIVIWKNRPLLSALRLEHEDVSQQLAITMLLAIRKFDPDRSASLTAHVWCSLQYEILNIKRRFKPHGVTGIPKDCKPDFLYLDRLNTDGGLHELSCDDDMTAIDFHDLFECLSDAESEAFNLKIQGFPVRRKEHAAALDGVRKKYEDLYC